MDFAVPVDHRVILMESERIDKYLDLARGLKKKTIEHENDDNTNCNWCTRYCNKMIGTRAGRLGNKRMSGDHPNYSTFKISQNTERSPGDMRRLAVTQTPVENHQLTLRRTLKRIK